ncbi:CHAT domain-containing protein [Terfezia claveryi]|nr:CHAT domain-containing protein [Terfezia claveryi]
MLLSNTGDVDKLRVKDIASLKLPALRLAYLSACDTANTTTFLDEVTHIVSSFHIAGSINVIGTLWQAEDEACHKMAADFYSALSKTDNVAASYRHAVLGLMKQKPAQPKYWAPFIHFGA